MLSVCMHKLNLYKISLNKYCGSFNLIIIYYLIKLNFYSLKDIKFSVKSAPTRLDPEL